MIARFAVAVVAASLLVAGCGGDDDGPGLADASLPDAGSPDASLPDAAEPDAAIVCDLPAPGAPGGTCAVDADCDSAPEVGDGLCLVGITVNGAWPEDGYCVTAGCPADGCAEGSACVTITSGPDDTFQFCMPECCEADTCGTDQVCNQRLFADPMDTSACLPGSAAALDGDACTSVADCDAHSICRFDPFTAPGGLCRTVGCTIGDDSTCAGGDGYCIDEDGEGPQVPGCVDACTVDADCRVAEGYECHDGSAEGLGSYCRHREAGEACEVAADCGVDPWVCRSGDDYPGGYCTVEACTPGMASSCPVRSSCYDPDEGIDGDEFCAADCSVGEPLTCRPGYLCALVGGQASAVCLPAPA